MAGIISLENLKLEESNGSSRLLFDYAINDVADQIYFEVEEKYGKYLCHELADAFVILFLPYAILHGFNIKSKIAVTEDLLYNLTMYLIPTIIRYNPEFFSPHIDAAAAELDFANNSMGGGIGISFSGGVDSYYTVLKHAQSDYLQSRPVYLYTNDISGLGRFDQKQKNEMFDNVAKIAGELGYPLVVAWSNAYSKVKSRTAHNLVHNFTSSFGIFCLQKLWSIHLYSSGGYRLTMANIGCTFKVRKGSFRDENFFHQFLSTKNLKVYCSGTNASRQDKIAFIADFPVVQKYFNVCLNSLVACNVCDKCMQTLLGIDLAGKIDKFGAVFDIEYYKNNRPQYYQYMFDRVVIADDPFFKELLEKFSGRLSKEEYDHYMKLALEKIAPPPVSKSTKYRRKAIRIIIKGLVDKKKYKKLKRDPNGFFRDSKNSFIKLLGRYYG